MSYLWIQNPEISSPPESIIDYFVYEDGLEIFECALFLLENQSFAVVRFSTENKEDEKVGVTEVEEFDFKEEAVKLFFELTKKEI